MPVSSVHYITDRVEGLEDLLKSGLDWVQLRVKGKSEKELFQTADRFVALCEKYKAYSIINDYPSLVLKVGADGVHLGKEDMSVEEARKVLGDGFIIGGTANTFEDILALHESRVDYIGLGPFRFTSTKTNLSPVLGLEGYTAIMEKCRDEGISAPVLAIGGITPADLEALYNAGVHGVAISSAISKAQNRVEAFKAFQAFNAKYYE